MAVQDFSRAFRGAFVFEVGVEGAQQHGAIVGGKPENGTEDLVGEAPALAGVADHERRQRARIEHAHLDAPRRDFSKCRLCQAQSAGCPSAIDRAG